MTSPLPHINSSANLPLPNPFKALTGLKSAENLSVEAPNSDSPRISLNDAVDMGVLPLNGQLVELRFDNSSHHLSGWARTNAEVLVSNFMTFSEPAQLPMCSFSTVVALHLALWRPSKYRISAILSDMITTMRPSDSQYVTSLHVPGCHCHICVLQDRVELHKLDGTGLHLADDSPSPSDPYILK